MAALLQTVKRTGGCQRTWNSLPEPYSATKTDVRPAWHGRIPCHGRRRRGRTARRLLCCMRQSRGWPALSPAMTRNGPCHVGGLSVAACVAPVRRRTASASSGLARRICDDAQDMPSTRASAMLPGTRETTRSGDMRNRARTLQARAGRPRCGRQASVGRNGVQSSGGQPPDLARSAPPPCACRQAPGRLADCCRMVATCARAREASVPRGRRNPPADRRAEPVRRGLPNPAQWHEMRRSVRAAQLPSRCMRLLAACQRGRPRRPPCASQSAEPRSVEHEVRPQQAGQMRAVRPRALAQRHLVRLRVEVAAQPEYARRPPAALSSGAGGCPPDRNTVRQPGSA